ncbi:MULTISPECIES: phage antirepressor KilAC domain-containing protein [Cysteiniphilum]|uniref:Antirepressor protein C-terminal domain-containing protein n=1 Tax=Cysteiniphilum litorale TaxID=2056700 RepID=A0A8J2Z5L1_9GAMM|nr:MULTISPECIES: phage antirepressor KilAC domain-containing protein [Cysteiniphilum]GGG03144.1 hypothetical protein GCM10010995_20730 [Cysteiniphilum litorale]
MKNLTVLNNDKLTMSSREIAALVEKRHDNVKRTIDTLLEKKLIGCPQIEDGEKSANGVVEKVYLIGKRDSYVIVAQLSPEFTARLVDRWQELEAKSQSNLPNFSNPAEAARAWALQYEQNQSLLIENTKKDQLIGEYKPKADYVDMILKSTSLVTITQIAKDYGKSGRAMNKLLNDLGIQYYQSGQWLLYSKYHAQGYTHSETINIKHNNGLDEIKMTTKWTQKGRLFLYDRLKAAAVLPLIEQKAA